MLIVWGLLWSVGLVTLIYGVPLLLALRYPYAGPREDLPQRAFFVRGFGDP
jgi:hypothetical protein